MGPFLRRNWLVLAVLPAAAAVMMARAGNLNLTMSVRPLLVCIGAIALLYAWSSIRLKSVIDRWARRNGYEIIKAARRDLLTGPYSGAYYQLVYRVTVREPSGRVRHGWVHCGWWWSGLWSSACEVEWDEGST